MLVMCCLCLLYSPFPVFQRNIPPTVLANEEAHEKQPLLVKIWSKQFVIKFVERQTVSCSYFFIGVTNVWKEFYLIFYFSSQNNKVIYIPEVIFGTISINFDNNACFVWILLYLLNV